MPPPVTLLRAGHRIDLLQGSGELFPALIAAIDGAQRQVRLETYIFDFTGSGAEVAYALERAGRRGVQVQVVVDGFGTATLPPFWGARFAFTGVQWTVYSPLGWLGMLAPGSWRRMHRKLCVVDGALAFCGGINILDDFHDPSHGRLEAPRLDFAVRVTGPLVAQVHEAMEVLWQRTQAMRRPHPVPTASVWASLRGSGTSAASAPPAQPEAPPRARAALVLRDNLRNRTRIERAYRRAIARARDEIIIANAYFVPGRKMRQALLAAAQRGVRVQLLLQGRYEYFMQYYAARPVYGALLAAGVEIYEYSPSFLHAKVAVIDGLWATVGSSNLDPLSLLLAREANVLVRDADFAGALRGCLVQAMQLEGGRMDAAGYASRPRGERVREWVALTVMRLALMVQGKKYL